MTVYQTASDGKYVGAYVLTDGDKSPRSGQYIIPAGCVTIAPPEIPDGMELYWQDGGWVLTDIPTEPDDAPTETIPEPQVIKDHVSDLEIAFAEYVIETEQRLTELEDKINA